MSLNIQKIPPVFTECHKKLNSIGRISPESVSNLSADFRQSIRGYTPKRLLELAKMNCLASEKIKSELDKIYGENNYVLIAIGRSLSSIAEQMTKSVTVKTVLKD